MTNKFHKISHIIIIILFMCLSIMFYHIGKIDGRKSRLPNDITKLELLNKNEALFEMTQKLEEQIKKRDDMIDKLFKLYGM